jgi:L-amino acid N-acyltransferase YncA
VNPFIRIATDKDTEQIQKIYEPIVRHTPISFEIEVPSVSEIKDRMQKTLVQYPWLVYEDGGKVVGYCYAGVHRTRLAYQWSTEVTLYIDENFRGKGIGKKLYLKLFEILRKQGYRNAVGGITLPNIGSVGIHEALGFTHVATFEALGYKQGAWYDVGFWQLQLLPYIIDPPPPEAFSTFKASSI